MARTVWRYAPFASGRSGRRRGWRAGAGSAAYESSPRRPRHRANASRRRPGTEHESAIICRSYGISSRQLITRATGSYVDRHSDRSTDILPVGQSGSTNVCIAIVVGLGGTWRTSLDVSPTSPRTGGLACGRTAGQWALMSREAHVSSASAPGVRFLPGDSPGGCLSVTGGSGAALERVHQILAILWPARYNPAWER
jgi:hypothetical protein